MSRARAIVTGLCLGLLWLVLSLPSGAMQASPEELCGPSAGDQIRCPRTSAQVCLCYLHNRTHPGEFAQVCLGTGPVVKVPRPALPLLRHLPRWDPPALMASFLPSVPTPPPRATFP